MAFDRLRRAPARAWFVAALAWAAMIFVLSHQPSLSVSPDPLLDLPLRKVAHMAVYGILAVLLYQALQRGGIRAPRRWAFTLAVAYALTDELHQSFVASRDGSLLDVGIDAAGALLGLWLAGRLPPRSGHARQEVRG